MDFSRATTEARNPASACLDQLSPLELVRLMNTEDATVAAAVATQAESIASAIERISNRLRAGGRLVYVGAGTSGRLGVLDASECPPTFNSDPGQVIGVIAGGPAALTSAVEGAEDDPVAAIRDLDAMGLGALDCVVGIATSGRTPYVVAALQHARKLGALTVGLTCNRPSALEPLAEILVAPVVGAEILAGSTRLKAGTATKLVLNMLSTGVMVGLGKTYGDLMVDLQTRNAKLLDRSRRIVMELTGVDAEQATALLGECGGDTKTAIVAGRRSCSPPSARAMLRAAAGRLREALEAPEREDEATSTLPRRDLVVGVDGGGTKTIAWVCSEQQLGAGAAGPSHPVSAGWLVARRNIESAIGLAIKSAGVDEQRIAAICLAIAGTGQTETASRLRRWAEGRWPDAAIAVVTDMDAVLAAGLKARQGVALICGTGSIAMGEDANGSRVRAGGWGWLAGDEGSAFAMGQAAMKLVNSADDGRREATGLAEILMDGWKVADVAALRQAMNTAPDPRFWLAQCGGMILKGRSDDPDRRAIIETAARDLADMVAAVCRRVRPGTDPSDTSVLSDQSDPADPSSCPAILALAGSVLIESEELRELLVVELVRIVPTRFRLVLVRDPVEGAVEIARQMAVSAI